MSILILFISAGVLFKGAFSLWVPLKINFPNSLSVFSCFMNCNNVFGTSCEYFLSCFWFLPFNFLAAIYPSQALTLRCSAKSCSEKFSKIHRETPVSKSFSNKVASCRLETLLQRESSAVALLQIMRFFQSSFYRKPWKASSDFCNLDLVQVFQKN